MPDNLKHKTAVSTLWLMFDKAGQQIIYLLVGIVLARILAVGDFALIGMLSIFAVFSGFLIDSGLSGAVIREKTVDDKDYATLFVFNICIALFLYVVLFFCAPLIAAYYRQPALVWLSRFVFLAIPINAFALIRSVLLTRQMNFSLQTKINFISFFIAGCTAVVLAMQGFGAWAIASQTVVHALIRVILLWCNSDWRLSFKFQKERLQKYWPFTSRILLSGLLNISFNNIYTLIIGRQFSKTVMGYYTQACKFSEIPNTILNGPIQSVGLAAFSQVHDDRERFLRAGRKSMRTQCFLLFPIMFGLICIARPTVMVILGTKWEGIILFFQLLCLSNIFTGITNLNNTFLNIKGLSGVSLYLDIIKLCLLAIAILLTISDGIVALLYGLLAVRLIYFFMNSFIAGRKTGYTLGLQLKDIFPYLLISMTMFAAAYAWTFIIENNILLLTAQVVTGALVYVGLNEWLGSQVYKDAKKMVREQIKSRFAH